MIQLDKSEFVHTKIIYPGHIITSEGIKPDSIKLKALLTYPQPKNVKDIQRFLVCVVTIANL